jgi:DNA (cytosine-5)-methyltransferase 1
MARSKTHARTPGARQPRPTAIDLFCGAGGFSLGLEQAGFNVTLGVDNWGIATDTYANNFTHTVVCADLARSKGRTLLKASGARRGDVDLVVGGPPCQGFSIQRIGSDHDSRNSLVLEYARLLKEILPRLFVLENVPGLIGARGKPLFNRFVDIMTAAGFGVAFNVVDAVNYGVPQHRRRVLVLGWRRKDTSQFIFPPVSHAKGCHKTVMDAIGDLPAAAARDAEKVGDVLHRETRLSDLNLRRLLLIPPGGGMQDLPVAMRVRCHKKGADAIGHRYVYGRLAPDRPANTITARFDSFTRGRFAHPHAHRNITLREGARLQTFPDTFHFCGNQEDIAAQIGNAVPPALAQAIGTAAIQSLLTPRGSGGAGTQVQQMALFV